MFNATSSPPNKAYSLFFILVFIIVKANDLAKSVKYKCVFCKRMFQNLETQFMADLPDIRLAPFIPPFHHTACDYFGPIVVKVGRNKAAKHYGVLFTCLNTRAIHLELAVDCSTMEFLQVLRRFFAIRGTPAVMISDNNCCCGNTIVTKLMCLDAS